MDKNLLTSLVMAKHFCEENCCSLCISCIKEAISFATPKSAELAAGMTEQVIGVVITSKMA